MGAMYRLKAYFGMIPDDEMGEYADEYEPAYGATRSAGGRHDERSSRDLDEGWDDRSDRRWADDERTSYDDEWERRQARGGRSERPVTTVRDHVRAGGMAGGMAGAGVGGGGGPAVRGALAIDPDTLHDREFVQREAPSREFSGSVVSAVPEPRDPAGGRIPAQAAAQHAAQPARIVTLHPRSYTEARAIGERFRDGVPVIMNLTELDAASAKRLVDFAAGLVFALRGGFDKVTNRVFLLTPANIEVSADDARKLASRSVVDR